jgi:hypothetical protein
MKMREKLGGKMKKMKLLIITLAFLLTLSSIGSAAVIKNTKQTKEPDKVNPEDVEYYAVLIGVAEFKYIETLPEDKLDDDAIAMHNLLRNSKNWKEENTLLLTNENATKEAIQDSIVNWLDEREDENDVVLYYFSGHSLKMPLKYRKHGHTFSFPYNISDFKFSEDKITDIELDSWLDELESNNICLILDTCYSGRMRSLIQKNRVILTAGGKHFFCGVDESDALGYGIFTFFVMQALKGIGDFNKDGWVTAEECFRYAKLPTIHSSIWRQFPFIQEWNNQTIIWFFQVPTMYDRYRGSFKLIEYQL